MVDAVVIGAGVNGLVAAHYLARRGRRVVVLERRSESDWSADVGWVPPRMVRDLALDRWGFRVERADPWAQAPLAGGGRLQLWADLGRSVEAIRRVSPKDAEKWPAFCERMHRLTGLLGTLYAAPPPDVVSREPAELLRLAGLGLRARRLGKQGLVDLLRIFPMSVAELLDDWFESDVLKGILGAAGVMHLHQGPRSGGTAFLMLHHGVGSPPGVFRPPCSNLGRVLEQGSAERGIEVRRASEVTRITVREGRAAGVVLASGEEIAAPCVVSGADPRRTLLEMVDPGWLDPDFVRAVRHIRCRGVVARVRLLLRRSADFTSLVVAPSLEYIERAYDDAKYGRTSRRPLIVARAFNSGGDSDNRVQVHAQYAPYALAEGVWDDASREALGDAVIGVLSEHAPELQSRVVSREVLSPADLEQRYGYPEGSAYHGELSLDQSLFMRPVPGWSRYRTPIGGLYLCGPGTHPGGGIAGAAGMNAAHVILGDVS